MGATHQNFDCACEIKTDGEIEINLKAIPSIVQDDLAAAVLDSIQKFIMLPGGREILGARIAARRNG